MAGQPKRRAMIAELTKRCCEEHDDGTAHLDYAIAWVEGGRTLVELAADLALSIDGPKYPNDDEAPASVSREMLSGYLHRTYGEDALTKLNAARARGAHAISERAAVIMDEADTSSSAHVAKAKGRADIRLWLAERWNKTDLGKAPDTLIQLNLSDMHLDAMRVRSIATSGRDTDSDRDARAFISSAKDCTLLNESAIDYAIVGEGSSD